MKGFHFGLFLTKQVTIVVLTKQLMTRKNGANRRLSKKRVQYLNKDLCFLSSLVLADSLMLRDQLLRQAPKNRA